MLAKLILSLFFLPSSLVGGQINTDVLFVQPGIETTSQAYIVREVGNKDALLKKNVDIPLPIASITKLMTALVFLDEGKDMDAITTLSQEDDRIGGKLYVFEGEEVSLRDLFFSALVGSANNAAMALARATKMPTEEFVKKMNIRAQELGMTKTRFWDPTGLDIGNYSSAYDVSLLMEEVLKYPEILEALQRPVYEFQTRNTHNKHAIANTNALLESFFSKAPYIMLGGKTGYLDEAGFCFSMVVEKDGRRLITVVLGSKDSDTRFHEAKTLLYWAFESLYTKK